MEPAVRPFGCRCVRVVHAVGACRVEMRESNSQTHTCPHAFAVARCRAAGRPGRPLWGFSEVPVSHLHGVPRCLLVFPACIPGCLAAWRRGDRGHRSCGYLGRLGTWQRGDLASWLPCDRAVTWRAGCPVAALCSLPGCFPPRGHLSSLRRRRVLASRMPGCPAAPRARLPTRRWPPKGPSRG